MMASPSNAQAAQLIDARYATFNNVAGNQQNVQVSIDPTTTLDILPYAEGASWNPELVCLRNTRTELFDDLWKWIDSADDAKTAEILLLCDVAGAGKSAVAHTVAQTCSDKGVLASSFFFDRNIPDRRTPLKLFSTIALDLARLNDELVVYVSRVLENNRSVASAGQSRQFNELILKPACQHRFGRPVVIVIDALDEGCDRVTLSILRNQVPKLPGTFRIIVTSRPTDDVRADLSNISHIRYRSLDIHGNINQRDIALYIRDRLRYISSRRQLHTDWPGEQRTRDFIRQAEGLFVWVSTVSEYLLTAAYPDRKLSTLLYERNLSSLRAEAKIDALYAEVLGTCDWNDYDFVHDFKLVIGAIMAVKTPLSSSALQSLHREHSSLEVNEVLRPLSSVLTGLFNEDSPIQILHLSFRDFLTNRAHSSSAHERFQVNEKEHSQRLALLCLRILNEDLTDNISGTGYLTGRVPETKGIPPLDGSRITEVVWYACRFWAEHIIEVEGPMSEAFLGPLRQFLTKKLIVWMEILNSKYPFQVLYGVREWFQRTFPSELAPLTEISGVKYSRTIVALSDRLSYRGRREEALEAIKEAVALRRQLAADNPAFNSDLASALKNLSNHLSGLGRRNDALEANLEAAKLHRQLAAKNSAFNSDLAGSLRNLSNHLSGLGRRKEALEANLEAVELHQRLAADNPAFNSDLASSRKNLSNHLSGLGRRKDALEAILEAVSLHRQLAADKPGFNADLAQSLDSLSSCLLGLGRRKEALEAILEAVDLRRQLAANNPAFNADLGGSLVNLSNHLSGLGRRKSALEAILEAVDLRRQLAANNPAFNADLAGSLRNLANHLTGLGRRKDALEAIFEAVDLHRRLAAENPGFNADLAGSLTDLSNRLSGLGRRREALEAIQEAVDLRQRLSVHNPAFNADLADSLKIQASHLSGLGRRGDALEPILEAVKLHRQLAADNYGFNANLAGSLSNLSNHLSGLGRREDALEAITEAVKLHQQLAADNPGFRADLASSLTNLSNHLSGLGRRQSALEANQEAVDLRRRLAEHNPAFNSDLAGSLKNLSNHLSTLERREDALEAILEAVKLHRQLAADNPGFNADVASSLKSLSKLLSTLGRREDALEAILEAVNLHLQLTTDSAAFNVDLADSLSNLSDRLSDLGRREQALEATQETAEIRQQPTDGLQPSVSSKLRCFISRIMKNATNTKSTVEEL